MAQFLSGLFGLFKPQPNRHFVAIDIGSNAAVRSLLLAKTPSGIKVLDKRSCELPARERETELIPHISEYLRQLLFTCIRLIGKVPDKTLLGLGSYYASSEIALIKQERADPAKAVHEEEFEAIIKEFAAEHNQKHIRNSPYALAHLAPFRMSVDGYALAAVSRTTRGRSIEVAILATYVSRPYWEALSRLKSILGGLPIEFISNQAAVASAIASRLAVSSALIIKIGSRITEAAILWEGLIRSVSQFDIGGDDFTAAIAKRLGFGWPEAERLKRQLGTVALPKRTQEAANEAVDAVAERWIKELAERLKAEERFILPERVYLLGGGARLSAISGILRSRPWFGELTFLEHLDIRILRAEDLPSGGHGLGAPDFAGGSKLSGPEETALAALVHRLSE